MTSTQTLLLDCPVIDEVVAPVEPKPRKPKPRTILTAEQVDERTRERGWFQNQLWLMDAALWGRWSYWQAICFNGTIGEQPEWAIPQIPFKPVHALGKVEGWLFDKLVQTDSGQAIMDMVGTAAEARKHLLKIFERCLHEGAYLRDLIDWWLWGFGSNRIAKRPELPGECARILYQDFQLHRLMAHPTDWGSELGLEFLGNAKKHSAWFPTPLNVARMMARMQFGGIADTRAMKVNDPCVGTGVFLLAASNYSLRLYAQDIDPLMCSLCEFHGWLYIPWLVWGNANLIREFREQPKPAVEIDIPAVTNAAPLEKGGDGWLFEI